MTWSLTKPLDLVRDMLMCGDDPNVSVTVYEEKRVDTLRFRDGSISLCPTKVLEKLDLCCVSHLRVYDLWYITIFTQTVK